MTKFLTFTILPLRPANLDRVSKSEATAESQRFTSAAPAGKKAASSFPLIITGGQKSNNRVKNILILSSLITGSSKWTPSMFSGKLWKKPA